MRLSNLQKYILINLLGSKGQCKRNQFFRFYDKQKNPPKKDDQHGILTKSLERLIDKGLMIGYGRRTPEKWFIDEVSLTAKGKKQARKLSGEQQHLPFLIKKVKK
jgi:hypothetical protein